MPVLPSIVNSMNIDNMELVENIMTRHFFKEALRLGRHEIDMSESEDIIKKANENAWSDLEELQAERRELVQRVCTRQGKQNYDKNMNIVAGGAYDVAKYITSRINFHVFCMAIEKGEIFCLDTTVVNVSNIENDGTVGIPRSYFSCMFMSLNMQEDRHMFPGIFPAQMSQLHGMASGNRSSLREEEHGGFMTRKIETTILNMRPTLNTVVDFSMRERYDGNILFFASFSEVDFKGMETPLFCPFCRQMVEVDLCSLHKEMLEHMASPTKTSSAKETTVCAMLGCDKKVEFMPPLACCSKCSPTFCYECVWKYVTKKQNPFPICMDM